MKKFKNLYILMFVVLGGFVLTGCTKETEDVLDEVEQRVEVLDTDNSDGEAIDDDNQDEVDVVTEDDTKEDEVATEAEDDTEEEEVVAEFAPDDNYDGATNEDNIRITKYNYYYESGQLVYEWTFASGNTDQMIASYEAGYDEDSNLLVRFPSLTTDHVAKDGESVELGSTLPTLSYERDGLVSTYKFENGEENDYEFTISDDTLVLKLDL